MAAPTIPGFTDLTEVGRGGFGTVYRSPQPGFGRDVAIKVLDRGTSTLDERSRRRFRRETEITGKLSGHPHIVTLHQAGFTDDDRPYLVMAFHEGGSLRDRVDRSGPVGWQEVSSIGIDLAGALGTAHAAGIIHRDVKPDNVLVDDFDAPVLTDFGIASLIGPELSTVTATGQMTMTIAFSPPEVLDGARPEERTDVFALGATLFALLTGHPPFVRPGDESLAPILARIVREDAPDLTGYGVPAPLAQVIARALARDISARTPSAVALGSQLQAAQRSLGLPVTDMVLPREVDVGDVDERTLALPDLDLPGFVQQTPPPGPHDEATAPLGATPSTTPTEHVPPRTATEQLPPVAHQAPVQPLTPSPAPTPRRGSGIKAALLGVLIGAAVLVVAGVGYLFALDGDEADPVATSDADVSAATTARATPAASTTAGTAATPAASSTTPQTASQPVSPTVSPATGPPSTPPDAPTATPGGAPDVAITTSDAEAPAVARTLQQWHDGINAGEYQRAFDTYTPTLQQQVTFERFRDGNATSQILAPAVTGVRPDGDGLIATISFRSLQDPSLGPQGQDCSDWVLEWTMRAGGGQLPWLVDAVDAVAGSPRAC